MRLGFGDHNCGQDVGMEKNKGGRPGKLDDALIKNAKRYTQIGFAEAEEVIPSVAGLACYLNISRSTVYEYKDQNSEFSYILEEILSRQEKILINGGLSNSFNSTITKLLLTKHGYSDKQDIDMNVDMSLSAEMEEARNRAKKKTNTGL